MAEHHDIPVDPDLDPADPSGPAVGAPARPHDHRHRRDPGVLVAIALGGMVGASARYGVARLLPVHPGRFPWATFWTNLSGSFVLGVLLVVVLERLAPTRYLRPFLATGVLGAFTTMSTYAVETVLLVHDGHPITAVAYGVGSLVAGVGLAWAGIALGRLAGPRHLAVPR